MSRPELDADQVGMLDRAHAEYEKGARAGIFQGATGFGKTWVIAEQARRAWSKGVGVLSVVHRRRLVNQLSDTFAAFGVPHGVIMDGRPDRPGPVQIASRDTLYAMQDAGESLPDVRLLQIDECHNEYGRLLDFYRRPYKSGFTATVCKGDGSGLGRPWQFVVPGPDPQALIDRGRLVPIVCFDPEAVGKARQKGEPARVVGNPISHWRQYAEGRPTVVFAKNRAAAVDVRNLYAAAGVPAEYADGDTPDDDRDAIFDRLASGRTMVVVNVGIMTEGVDVPCLSCCQFLRGVTSFVLYRQGVGRVMRAHPGKKDAVLLDHAGAAHEFGLPTDPVDWQLDPSVDHAAAARKRAREEGRRVTSCPRCAVQFARRADCPACGWKPPRKRAAMASFDAPADGLLTRYEGEPEKRDQLRETLVRLWISCLYTAAARGQRCRVAAAIFRGRAKCGPEQAGVGPLPPPGGWDRPVSEVLPQFNRKRSS
jgi:superfamily II DNA or RNA helicase